MRAVLQRCLAARVEVARQVVGEIDSGICIFVGIERGDETSDLDWMARKILAARIFEDEAGKMNRGVLDVGGSLLLVSQFTLLGDLRSGNRPSFNEAMAPEAARELFEHLCQKLQLSGAKVEQGRFREEMQVFIQNDGPVTLLLDSRRLF